jgi:hypothetical protein
MEMRCFARCMARFQERMCNCSYESKSKYTQSGIPTKLTFYRNITSYALITSHQITSLHFTSYHIIYSNTSFNVFAFHPCLRSRCHPSTPVSILDIHMTLLHALVDLLVRKPLARLKILLFERRIQNTQATYLTRTRRIISLDISLRFAISSLESKSARSL